MERGASTCDGAALEAGIAPGDASVALARLELLGYLETDAAGRYARTTLLPPDAALGLDQQRLARSGGMRHFSRHAAPECPLTRLEA